MRDLGSLGGFHSGAWDINDKTQIVGGTSTRKHLARAFLWQNGKMQLLSTLADTDSTAAAINNKGQIVGTANTSDTDPRSIILPDPMSHAFLYRNGKMYDLNNLIPDRSGWVLVGASDINDAGQIVGMGTIKGQRHAFLLTPLPVNGSTAD